jgi:hypothetical protein
MPHPDPCDPETLEAGVRKRFACAPPPVDPDWKEEFRLYVRRHVRKKYKPLSPETDLTGDTWLKKTNYPEWRKQEIREAAESCHGHPLSDPRNFECKSFMKDECYAEYKHARAINSRHDRMKWYFGPIFKAIEEVLYNDPWFIKHVPVKDRPKYLLDRLGRDAGMSYETDFETFETSFTAEVMEICEFELYDWMMSEHPLHDEFVNACYSVLAGENKCVFKYFILWILGCRMSGEMNTSLGNGFTNKMLLKFVCKKVGCSKVRGAVEGDDGATRFEGTPPTEQDFARLGFRVKLISHQDISKASFCGLIFDPDELINVVDPREILASTGFVSAQYSRHRPIKIRALLRCKALSLAHQYPGCPVVGSFAQWILRCTRNVDVRRVILKSKVNSWVRDQWMSAWKDEKNIKYVSPGPNTRQLMSDVFKIDVEQQLRLERYFDSLEAIGPITDELVYSIMPDVWKHYWENYAEEVNYEWPLLNLPARTWPKMESFVREW